MFSTRSECGLPSRFRKITRIGLFRLTDFWTKNTLFSSVVSHLLHSFRVYFTSSPLVSGVVVTSSPPVSSVVHLVDLGILLTLNLMG